MRCPPQSYLQSHAQQTAHLGTLATHSKADFESYESTVDAWRHQRMIAPISPLCSATDWEWLTVGDAHGWDAARLQRMGCRSVTASDLSVQRLRHAAEEGLIEQYREENAESMTARDGSYDVVFCKEAFHHFPRPWIGLYEMLRVARQAVVLIEPRDWILDRGPTRPVGPRGLLGSFVVWLQQKLFKRSKPVPVGDLFRMGDGAAYEPVGNYVFSISSREIEKVALGLDLPAVAFCFVNDHFEEGLSKHLANDSFSVFRRIRDQLEMADRKSARGYRRLLSAAGCNLQAVAVR